MVDKASEDNAAEEKRRGLQAAGVARPPEGMAGFGDVPRRPKSAPPEWAKEAGKPDA